MLRAQDITVCLIGSKNRARLDLTDDSGFWLRVKAEDAAPFLADKEVCYSTLSVQIIKIEEGPD